MTRTGFSLLASVVPVLVVARMHVTHADPLAVRTAGALPFSTGELESALALRAQLATAQATARLEASLTSDGTRVQIELLGRRRWVALDGQHGADAARLVAFAILDLAGDEIDPPDAPTVHDVPAPLQMVAVAPARLGPARDRGPALSMMLWGSLGSRTEAMLELGIAVRGPLRVTITGGIGPRTTTTAMDRRVTLRLVPARAGIAWRAAQTSLGELDLRASALVLIADAAADRSHTDVVAGGGVAASWVVPIAGFALVVGAGVDGFASALDYRVGGTPVLTTDRLGWWAGLGIAREVAR